MSKRAKRIIAVAIGLATGLFVTLWGGGELLTSARLAWGGKTATAQVMDAQELVSPTLHRHSYRLLVAFQTANRSLITKKVLVSKEVFTAAKRKGGVKIHYLAADPATCAAGTKVEVRYGNFVLGLLLLGVAGFLATTLKQSDSRPGISPVSDQSPSLGGAEPAQSPEAVSQTTSLPAANEDRQNPQCPIPAACEQASSL
jgi:hypothetical protein